MDVPLFVNVQLGESSKKHGRGCLKGLCRRNMVGSLPRGMPRVVDYRQTDAQAINKMVMQDRHKILSRFGHRKGVIPTSCV